MNGTEPTIICPKCKAEIKITESLAAPLVDAIRRDYESRLARKDADNGNFWSDVYPPDCFDKVMPR